MNFRQSTLPFQNFLARWLALAVILIDINTRKNFSNLNYAQPQIAQSKSAVKQACTVHTTSIA